MRLGVRLSEIIAAVERSELSPKEALTEVYNEAYREGYADAKSDCEETMKEEESESV